MLLFLTLYKADFENLVLSGPNSDEVKAAPFLVGDIYANNNPFLLSIAIIWHKWHNIVAERLFLNHNKYDFITY